jgi:hypothetical protein
VRTDDGRAWIDWALLALVGVVASGFAGMMFAGHLANAELLWRGVYHDRNSHLLRGIDYALALGSFDLLWFISALDRARVWPPLHGLVLSGVLLVGGIDHRLGILPSLIGWTVTVVCVWMIARWLYTDRVQGICAGAVAVTLTVASPSLRLLGTDVMLEGLGSALSALSILQFMRASAEPGDSRRWRLLALTLCALFLEKTNYWGLVVAGLALSALMDDWAGWRARARRWLGGIKDGALAHDAARHPLLIASVLVAAVTVAIYWRGPTVVSLLGREVRLYPPGNLTTLAYALLFAWGALQWRRHRTEIDAALGVPGRALFYWHAVPVAISFLIPKRLASFLWFVGPTNSPVPGLDPLRGLAVYWSGFSEGFHVSVSMAALVLALALVGAVHAAQLPQGARAVFALPLVSFVLLILHPHQQSRYLGSWVFAVWIAAGVGTAVIVCRLAHSIGARARAVLATLAVAAVIAANASTAPSLAAYRHAIYPTQGVTDIDLVRPYIHELDGVGSVMFVTTFGSTDLFPWVLHERCRCKVEVTHPWISGLTSRRQARDVMAQRVNETKAERIVLIDAPLSTNQVMALGWTYEVMAGVVDAMNEQSRFERTASYAIQQHGAFVSIWRRRA